MRARTLAVTTICLVVSALLLPAVSHAKNGGSSSTVLTQLDAKLQPCAGDPCDPTATPVEPGAEGKAERRTRTGSSARDEFKITVEIPEVNALGIDSTNAATEDIRATFNNGTIDYAECSLVFDEFDPLEMVFVYKVDHRVRNGVLTKSVGTCSGTLITPGSFPDVQNGHMVTVRLVNTPDIHFLVGTFAPK